METTSEVAAAAVVAAGVAVAAPESSAGLIRPPLKNPCLQEEEKREKREPLIAVIFLHFSP